MSKVNRREAIGGIIAGGGVLAFSDNVLSQREVPARAFAGKHQPKPLPFDASKLNGISEKLIRSHHENNYVGAVKR